MKPHYITPETEYSSLVTPSILLGSKATKTDIPITLNPQVEVEPFQSGFEQDLETGVDFKDVAF